MTDSIPTSNSYRELLNSIGSTGRDMNNPFIMAQINAHPDGTYEVWCVETGGEDPVYLGRLQQSFASQSEAIDAIAESPACAWITGPHHADEMLSELDRVRRERNEAACRADKMRDTLAMIADIAEGSRTANSLPNIARIARSALGQ